MAPGLTSRFMTAVGMAPGTLVQNANTVKKALASHVSAQVDTAKKSTPGSSAIKSGVDNMSAGDLDYQRAIEQAEAQRRFSASEAQKLRDWQEKMSNTAYSRAVKDLKSVGINPYAIGGFNAASTPSGAYGQSSIAGGYGSLLQNETLRYNALVSAISSVASSAIGSTINAAGKLFIGF